MFLGPLLFLLQTFDFFSIKENKPTGYVDDSTLMAVMPSLGVPPLWDEIECEYD